MPYPIAFFVSGPIAAGKSSIIKRFQSAQYTLIQYDHYCHEYLQQSTHYTILPGSQEKIYHSEEMENAFAYAEQKRNTIFQECIEHQKEFIYECTLSPNALLKMEAAHTAGFKIVSQIIFQDSLTAHIFAEKMRRAAQMEIGAYFIQGSDPSQAVKESYSNCLKGIETAAKWGDLNIYINHMYATQEVTKVAEKSEDTDRILRILQPITNTDLAQTVAKIIAWAS